MAAVCGVRSKPFSLIALARSESSDNNVARLRGIRLVTASETGDGNRLDESLIKDVTGGDRIAARFMPLWPSLPTDPASVEARFGNYGSDEQETNGVRAA